MKNFHSQKPLIDGSLSVSFEFEEASDKRILVVDDDDVVSKLFANCLSDRYSCVTAADSQEALVRLASEPFALVISDVNMPGLSGVELLRRIIEQFPDTAVIMVSGIDRSQRVLDAVRVGAFDYLIKPCSLDVLELTVERALERRMLLRNGKRYKHELERRNEELARQKSKLELLQAQLVHSEKMASLGQLAAGVAHELNNPVGFIYGNMEILSASASGLQRLLNFYDDAPLPELLSTEADAIKKGIDYEHLFEDFQSAIADCHNGAERIRDIVLNLRLFSRLDEAEYKKVDLHEGIESTIRLLSQYYGPGLLKLERDYAELPPVDCYAGRLNQVWMNLLVNAAHAVGSQGIVRVVTRIENKMAVVTISDTGSGISTENLNKIFDPFFTTKSVGDGTGLGLSISYGIIKHHGGSISVESRLDVGTSFTVQIPINSESQTVETE